MRRVMITAAVVSALLCCATGSAEAEGLSSWWHLSAVSPPLQPGGKGEIVVTASNLGDAPAEPPVTISDVLPAGLEAVAAEGFVDQELSHFGEFSPPVACSVGSIRSVNCVFTGEAVPGSIYEQYSSPPPSSVPPYRQIQVMITV